MYTLKFQWKDGVWTTCKGGNDKDVLMSWGLKMVEKDSDYIACKVV